MNADGEPVALGCGVDRPELPAAQRMIAHHQQQHLDEAAVGRPALDLIHCQFDILPGRLLAKPDAGLGHHADEMIERFRLQHVASALAGTLSYGQQKLIDIAMAFMAAPRLVLLDEPCAGVNPSLVDQLRELLVELNKTQGGSFVVIEHNMDFVMKLCPHVICMVEGKVLAAGPPAEVQANRQVLEAYLGN